MQTTRHCDVPQMHKETNCPGCGCCLRCDHLSPEWCPVTGARHWASVPWLDDAVRELVETLLALEIDDNG